MFHWTIHVKGVPKHRPVYVVVGPKIYSFEFHLRSVEVQVFNTVSFCWRKLPSVINRRGEHPVKVPIRRYGHTAVLLEDLVYIWGGYPYCNGRLCAFDVDNHRWSTPNVYGTIPEERYGHSACVLKKVMFIYGGRTERRYTKDIYELDTTTMVWALINTTGSPPLVSTDHFATIIGTKMFLFGGQTRTGITDNNITVFDTETKAWLSMPSGHLVPGPGPYSASANNGELYIFFGCKWSNKIQLYDSDLRKFNTETHSWKHVEPKGKGPGATSEMCCCMVGERMIVFGSYPKYDIHVLDLNPSLKMLCKLAVIQHGLEQSALPHDIRWELKVMTPIDNENCTLMSADVHIVGESGASDTKK